MQVVCKSYHNEIFEGNEITADVGYFTLITFVNACQAMDKVVAYCFSIVEENPNLDKYIDELKNAFESTELSKTLKIYVILEYLKRCRHFIKNVRLELWSAKAAESILICCNLGIKKGIRMF